jgi:hypothetical protein
MGCGFVSAKLTLVKFGFGSWLQKFLLKCFCFSMQQIVFLYIVIFALCMFLPSAFLPSVDSSDVLLFIVKYILKV